MLCRRCPLDLPIRTAHHGSQLSPAASYLVALRLVCCCTLQSLPREMALSRAVDPHNFELRWLPLEPLDALEHVPRWAGG